VKRPLHVTLWYWFLFAILGGLIPLVVISIGYAIRHSKQFPTIEILNEHGDLCIISMVMLAGAVGDVIGSHNHFVRGAGVGGTGLLFLVQAIFIGWLQTDPPQDQAAAINSLSSWLFGFSFMVALACKIIGD
jgi:hypothetical protein